MLPATVFRYDLWVQGAVPRPLPWLPIPETVYFPHNDNPPKAVFNFLLWFLEHVINLPVLIPGVLFRLFWFIFGFVLFETQVMSVGHVKFLWFGVWTGDWDHYGAMDIPTIDTAVFNRTLFASFLLDSVPMLTVQIINNSKLFPANEWGVFLILNLSLSSYAVTAGLWKYV